MTTIDSDNPLRSAIRALPHAYPFLFVDRLLVLEPGVRGIGLKNVTIDEPCFQGHFPGRPVFPGVLLVEALSQMAGIVWRGTPVAAEGGPSEGRASYLAGVDGFKFRRPVFPGDQVVLFAEHLSSWRTLARFSVRAETDGHAVAEGETAFVVMEEK
jgi:3-hydroxyacyl-[acyl-carrier-protein] dehydratase